MTGTPSTRRRIDGVAVQFLPALDSLVDFHTGHDANYRVAPGMPAPAETYFLVRCGLRATLRLNCVLVV